MTIFVTKLNKETNAHGLIKAFSTFGQVEDAKIIYDKFSRESKGYGFIEMPDDAAGRKAIEALNETELDGYVIIVKEAEPRKRFT